MSEMYRRRIRVEGGMKDISGYQLTVQDADTGEKILNVTSIDLHLSATGLNTATVTSYEHDETGKLVVKDDRPVIHVGETENPEVAITAMETMTELEQLRAEVQMYRDANMQRIQRRRELERKAGPFNYSEQQLEKIFRTAFERVNKWPGGDFSEHDATQTVAGMMQAVYGYMKHMQS